MSPLTHIPYEDPNTGVQFLYDIKRKSTLIRFLNMSGEISKSELKSMSRKFLSHFSKNQLMKIGPLKLVEWFREEIIAQCMYDWINYKK